MSRNYGIMSSRAGLGGLSTDATASDANTTRADSNPDLEHKALIFGCLVASPLLVASIVLFYLGLS